MPVPEDHRPQPPDLADERTLLEGFLDYHRATLLWKCAGLTDEQLRRRSAEPSSMSLLGLVRHVTDVESVWWVRRVGRHDVLPAYSSPDNIDGEFDDVDTADVAEAFAAYEAVLERSRAIAAASALDDTFVRVPGDRTMSVRWLYLHLIEDYARHNGHADLLRERIDGATGE